MKVSVVFDLDGTLVDSYDAILEAIMEISDEYGLSFGREYVETFIKEKSSYEMAQLICKGSGSSFTDFKKTYSEKMKAKEHKIKLMPGADEMLKDLYEKDAGSYIYTHKGATTAALLKRLGIDRYFNEVITGNMGFKRKPDSEALEYLITKHGLNKKTVYYVGDRNLDVECAQNAGVKSILLESRFASAKADYTIKSLIEICSIVQQTAIKTPNSVK